MGIREAKRLHVKRNVSRVSVLLWCGSVYVFLECLPLSSMSSTGTQPWGTKKPYTDTLATLLLAFGCLCDYVMLLIFAHSTDECVHVYVVLYVCC